MDDGPLTIDDGPLTTVIGKWFSHQSSIVNGRPSMVNGPSSAVHRQSPPSSPNSRHSSLPGRIRPFFLASPVSCFTFGFAMGLLDLDKIIIKRTILGIRCNSCGGNLVLSTKKTVSVRLIMLVTLGSVNPKNYECEQCRKRYILL